MTRFRGAKVCSKWLQENWRSQQTVWLQVQMWTKSENSILVCYACMVTLHDYTTDINDDMTTMTVFHTEHINTNTWVCFVLFILCQRIVTLQPHGSSPSCVRHSSHPHARMMCAVLPRHWALHPLHPLPHARRSSPSKGFPRTPSTMTPHSRICCVKLTEYMCITLNEKTCLSVSRRRLCPKERGDLLEKERGDLLSQVVRKHRLQFCWTDK